MKLKEVHIPQTRLALLVDFSNPQSYTIMWHYNNLLYNNLLVIIIIGVIVCSIRYKVWQRQHVYITFKKFCFKVSDL